MQFFKTAAKNSKRNAQQISTLSASIVCIVFLLVSMPAMAVNLEDPNLVEKTDFISRAALNCMSFMGLDAEFKTCLSSFGVTDAADQAAARSQAKSLTSPPNLSASERSSSPTVESASNRAPASTKAAQ